MRPRIFSWGVALVLSVVVCAGCRTPARPNPRTPSPHIEEKESDVERLARAHAHYAAGIIDELNRNPESALKEYSQAALEDRENEQLVLEVSRRLLQAKQQDKALEVINRAAQRSGGSAAILARKSLICFQLGKTNEAIAAARQSIAKDPVALPAYQNLFVFYSQSKEKREALAVLDQAAKQEHGAPDFYIGLAELYSSAGLQFPDLRKEAAEKALAVLARVEKANPQSPTLKMALAEQLYQNGEPLRAASVYVDLLKQLPDLPGLRERIHARLSEIYLRAEDHAKASEQLQALARDNPTNPQIQYLLGALAMEDRKPEVAVEHLRQAVLLKPDFDQAWYELANAQLSAGKTSDALATLEDARKKFPDNFVLEFLTGVANARQKAYDAAVEHYTKAEVIGRATDPRRLTEHFYFQFGAAAERRGDFAQAEKCFEEALRLQTNFVEAMNYLGYMWAERGTNLDRAKELISKAVAAQPTNAAYLDSLGWVLFKQGQPEKALPEIQRAIQLNDEPDATLYDHLGDIYQALGQTDKAREAWRKSVNIEASDVVSKKLENSNGPGP